jgi:two-component system phosphate regulon sensor histidine kinase PhoR
VSRLRHLLLVGLAALPLLVIVLVVVGQNDLWVVSSAVALWIVGVGVLAAVVWRETILPLAEVVHELEAESAQHARWRVREVKDQRDQASADVSELTQLLEDVSEGLGEGLVVVGPDLKVRLVNSKALHFLGVEKLSKGRHLLDALREPDAVEAVRTAARGEPARRAMVENPRGMWEVHAFPMSSRGAVVLITEVGLVRRAAELRRRFVQDLSHELRSPLAVMRTTVEAMEGEVTPQLSEMMIRQVERITRLTDELFELATIEAGAIDLKPEAQKLKPLTSEILADFQAVADQSGVELRMDLPEDLTCVCDRRGLYRVVSNLVDNAIKYNRDGGWVEVRGSVGRTGVTLVVEDSGVGIPAEELGAVMQRFYRIDQARTPGQGGLGLGLAIVKHMVLQMGGNLVLDSREGVGTVATLTLPPTARKD